MRGQTGHNTRPHARFSPSFLGMNAWMTLQLNVALFFELSGSLAYLAKFLTCYQSVFVQSGTSSFQSPLITISLSPSHHNYAICNYSCILLSKKNDGTTNCKRREFWVHPRIMTMTSMRNSFNSSRRDTNINVTIS